MVTLLIVIGKCIAFLSKLLNFGDGSTWPGHVALLLNKNFIKQIVRNQKTKDKRLKIVLIAGTNGKTTTGKLLQTILGKNGCEVFQNQSGANLLNGIASSFIANSDLFGSIEKEYAIFEVDENVLPLILEEIEPEYVVLLNLFRDQLDRYGEVNSIAKKWQTAIEKLSNTTTLILNADDPQIAQLGEHAKQKVLYFGLHDKKLDQTTQPFTADSTYCFNCGKELTYTITYFSHIGEWECKNCGRKRPTLDLATITAYPLPGTYNKYNTLAAVLTAKTIGVDGKTIESALKNFSPAFGRQEIITVGNKKIQLFLSKNPTSFNESLRTVKTLGAKSLVLILNDRIPDGLDVSWIWDVDFENLVDKNANIMLAGDRKYDMGLRIKYAFNETGHAERKNHIKVAICQGLKDAIEKGLKSVQQNETLYILPTYSAMLEIRGVLTGKKIL